jgi:hypothetical protein
MGYNRALSVTLRCLKAARLAGCVTIDLDIHLRREHSHDIDFFDPRSDDWIASFSNDDNSLGLRVQVDTAWALDLLLSARKLLRLELSSSNRDNYFSRPTSGPFVWPRLRCLDLSDRPCLHSALVTSLNHIGKH